MSAPFRSLCPQIPRVIEIHYTAYSPVPAGGDCSVGMPPVFSYNPESTNSHIGDTQTQFLATATGSNPLTYQWQSSDDNGATWVDLSNGADYTGINTTVLTAELIGTFPKSGFLFRSIASNPYGSATSSEAMLSIACPLITITLQPVGVMINDGSNASFSASATGTTALTYEWELSTNGGLSWVNLSDSSTYSGSLTPTLTVTDAQLVFNGFLYRCHIQDAYTAYGCTGVITNQATLTVNAWIHGWGAAIASGPVDALGSDPANPSHIVAGSHSDGPNQVQYSTNNGTTWTPVTIPGGWMFSTATSVCCGNGYFVVTGPDDGHLFRVAYCSVSNLAAWSSVTLGAVYTYGGLCACCFASDIGQFCGFAGRATGYLSSFTATNPAAWTEHTTTWTGSPQYGGICRGAGLFVAVTYSDTYISADNGLTWAHYAGSFAGGKCVVYSASHGKFVLGMDLPSSVSIYTASDGHNWVDAGVVAGSVLPTGITYTNGLVVAVGGTNSPKGSISSTDLVTWVSQAFPSELSHPSAVCPCSGGVIAGSDNGSDYVSISTI